MQCSRDTTDGAMSGGARGQPHSIEHDLTNTRSCRGHLLRWDAYIALINNQTINFIAPFRAILTLQVTSTMQVTYTMTAPACKTIA
jgi:hypothetical protein